MNAYDRHVIECRTIAIKLLDSPRGREAVAGGYFYLRLFTWTYREIESGRIPAGVPRELVEGWKSKKRG